MKLRTKVIQWGDLCVEVQEVSAREMLEHPQRQAEIAKLVLGKDTELSAIPLLMDWFLFLIMQTKAAQLPGIDWPNGNGNAKDYKAAYEYLHDLPGGFVRAWREAIRDLDRPPIGDPELAPPESLSEEEKKVSE